MVLINHTAPGTFMEMDYIRFMLGFPTIKMILRSDGVWQVKVEQVCGFFDQSKNFCTVHATSQQPRTCSYYNPHHCWYKRNYTKDEFYDLVEMDLAQFDVLLRYVKFDEDGKIVEIPTWEFLFNLLNGPKLQTVGSASSLAERKPIQISVRS
jgi:hypothetical protein